MKRFLVCFALAALTLGAGCSSDSSSRAANDRVRTGYAVGTELADSGSAPVGWTLRGSSAAEVY